MEGLPDALPGLRIALMGMKPGSPVGGRNSALLTDMSPMYDIGDMENTPEYQTIRVWTRTLKKLRLVAALTGERMVAVMDRLVSDELKRVEHEHEQDHGRADRPQDL